MSNILLFILFLSVKLTSVRYFCTLSTNFLYFILLFSVTCLLVLVQTVNEKYFLLLYNCLSLYSSMNLFPSSPFSIFSYRKTCLSDIGHKSFLLTNFSRILSVIVCTRMCHTKSKRARGGKHKKAANIFMPDVPWTSNQPERGGRIYGITSAFSLVKPPKFGHKICCSCSLPAWQAYFGK